MAAKYWMIKESVITALAAPGLEAVKIQTTDGLPPNGSNLDSEASFIKVSGVEHKSLIDSSTTVLDSSGLYLPSPPSEGMLIARDATDQYGFGAYVFEFFTFTFPLEVYVAGVQYTAALPLGDIFSDPGVEIVPPAEPTNVVLVGDKAVGEVAVNPTVSPGVTYGGGNVPIGSVLRNTVSGKKYIAGGGSAVDFVEIPDAVKAEWQLGAGADDAWAILQAK